VAGYDDLANCESSGGVWACGESTEICNNGVDDDGDGLTDCMDDDCQVTASLSDSEVSRYNCLGTGQTGSVEGLDYYCSVPESDDSVGLCCPVGQEAYYDSFNGVWRCQPTDPCYPEPPYVCSYEYSSAFDQWLGDSGCVSPGAGMACCSVVQFGEEDYWSDSGNVKVY